MAEISARKVTLRDGSLATLRLLAAKDTGALHRMFLDLAPKSRRFLYDDVTDIEVVRRWTTNIDPSTTLPIVVEVGSEIVADGTLHRKPGGPMRHVGRIRVVVRDGWQGKGIGTILTEELIRIAREEKLRLVSSYHAEFDEGDGIDAMKALGFRRVAIVPEYLMDPDGKTHSMAILVRRLDG